jgi:hypothetical protein
MKALPDADIDAIFARHTRVIYMPQGISIAPATVGSNSTDFEFRRKKYFVMDVETLIRTPDALTPGAKSVVALSLADFKLVLNVIGIHVTN